MRAKSLSFFYLILTFVLVSCGGGGGGSSDDDRVRESVITADLSSKTVSTSYSSLESISLSLEQYNLLTALSEEPMSSSGLLDIELIDNSGMGQIAFITDKNDSVIAALYFSEEQIESGEIYITVESLADGFIMLNPILFGYSYSDRISILDYIKSSENYRIFVDDIEEVINDDPSKLLDELDNKSIFVHSIELITDATEALGEEGSPEESPISQNLMPTSDEYPYPVVGNINGPYLSDVSGTSILAVNPTMVFYGISAQGQKARVIAGKESVLGAYVQKAIPFQNGNHKFSYNKYFPTDEAGLLSARANIIKIISMFLDSAGYPTLSNADIAAFVEGSNLNLETMFASWRESSQVSLKAMNIIYDFMYFQKDKRTEFLEKLYGPQDFFKKTGKNGKVLKFMYTFLDKFSKVASFGSLLLYGNDLFLTDDVREWCLTQNDGVLESSTTCQYVPPTASFTYSPSSGLYEGDEIIFDASESTDPLYESLVYQWDFDGDGTADTGWSTSPTATYSFSEKGVKEVVLYVRNEDALTGKAQKNIYIGEYMTVYQEDFSSDPGYSLIDGLNLKHTCTYTGEDNLKHIVTFYPDFGGTGVENGYYFVRLHPNTVPIDLPSKASCVPEDNGYWGYFFFSKSPVFSSVSTSDDMRIEFDFYEKYRNYDEQFFPGLYFTNSNLTEYYFINSLQGQLFRINSFGFFSGLYYKDNYKDNPVSHFEYVENFCQFGAVPSSESLSLNSWYHIIYKYTASSSSIEISILDSEGSVLDKFSNFGSGLGEGISFDEIRIGAGRSVHGLSYLGDFTEAEARIDNIVVKKGSSE